MLTGMKEGVFRGPVGVALFSFGQQQQAARQINLMGSGCRTKLQRTGFQGIGCEVSTEYYVRDTVKSGRCLL